MRGMPASTLHSCPPFVHTNFAAVAFSGCPSKGQTISGNTDTFPKRDRLRLTARSMPIDYDVWCATAERPGCFRQPGRHFTSSYSGLARLRHDEHVEIRTGPWRCVRRSTDWRGRTHASHRNADGSATERARGNRRTKQILYVAYFVR